VAPNGDVYIAAVDYRQTYEGDSHINVLKSTDGGGSWGTHHVDTSREMADCPWARGWGYGFPYGDYLEMADGEGANHVIWGEGESLDGNGGTWFTRGQ
jgi:hypothetical protein